VNSGAGQSADLTGALTVNGNASVTAASAFGLLGAATDLRIGGNLIADGTFTSDNLSSSVTFFSGTPGVISGGNVTLPATVRISKTGGALTSFDAGTAAAYRRQSGG
jgi:hypothetical protein